MTGYIALITLFWELLIAYLLLFTGTMSLDPKSNGKVSLVGFTYIFITNTIGALIGLAGAMIAQPGKHYIYFQKKTGVNFKRKI